MPPAWPNHDYFGRYRLVRRLGMGGMAEIFLASLETEAGFEKRVVLKRILPQQSEDPAFVSMFIDEAVIAAGLNHPNVVSVFDFGRVEDQYFLAMEWIDGEDFRAPLKRVLAGELRLRPVEIAAFAEQLCRGLGYVHQVCDGEGQPRQIVHRDISPHNVMISREGVAKVMDFGIAQATRRRTQTQAGMIKGKVAYMSPEQAKGEPLDARSDQFSLGVMLWEAATAQRLFSGRNAAEMLQQVVEHRPRPIADQVPGFPPELSEIVMTMLRKDPRHRFDDLREAAEGLTRFRFAQGEAGVVDLGVWLSPPELRQPAPTATATPRLHTPGPETADDWRPSVADGTHVDAQSRTSSMRRAMEVTQQSVRSHPQRWFVATLGLVAGALFLPLGWAGEGGSSPAAPMAAKPVVAPTPAVAPTLQALADRASESDPKNASPARTPKRTTHRLEPPAQLEPAVLSLRARDRRWYRVHLGARRLGETPLVGVKLPPGEHRLRIEDLRSGESAHLVVRLKPGERRQLSYPFD